MIFLFLLLFPALALFPQTQNTQQPQYTQTSDFVTLHEVVEDGVIHLYMENVHFIPIWIQIDFIQLENLHYNGNTPWQGLLPAQNKTFLFSLSPKDRSRSTRYRFSISYAEGNPQTARHNDAHAYLFPFAHGTKQQITQGYNGRFSHFGENQYAVDFGLEENTPVHAARPGRVVRVKEDSRIGGASRAFAQHANTILIAHDDGSFAYYVHLRYQGAVVELGDYVTAGDLIGYSGNTGQSTGPHLHFDVRLPQYNGKMQSIPIMFLGIDSELAAPKEGEYYYAVHPGGAPFIPVFGKDLTNQDFAGYKQTIRQTNTITTRSEKHDDTIALFLQNGFAQDIQATVSIRLIGMQAEKRLPAEVHIPAQTEVFFTLLRPLPNQTRLQYTPSIQYQFSTQ